MSNPIDRLIQFRKVYMNIALEIASLSRAKRRKVGAIIVKNNMIISYGYNGTPAGCDNVCEDENGETKPIVIHAEANAILKAAKEGIALDDAIMYLTFSPCLECSKLILQAGIREVNYHEEHSCTAGLRLLNDNEVLLWKV